MSQPTDNPYQSPGQVDLPPKRRTSTIYLVACLVWGGLAIKHAVIRPIARSLFEDLGVSMPTLTIYLVHPMSTVLLFVTAAGVIAAGLITKSAEDRNRIAKIAITLAVIAFAAIVLGLGLPAWSLLQALQSDVP